MKVLDKETKFAHLGKPGSIFSKGFQRRLDLIQKQLNLENKKILDQGCGEGVWMHEFTKFTEVSNVYGMDIDPESIEKFKALNLKFPKDEQIPLVNIKICPAEKLDFPDNFFEVVFSNEVFEHVADDKKAATEALRVLKPGGKLIIFTPNRGWPFETHGMFLKGKYYWGNIPFLPWMPKSVRKKLSPHVRNYSNGDIEKLFSDTGGKVIFHKHVFPAFDKLERKFGIAGRVMQKFFHTIEKTPLHFFGISHFIIIEKQ